MAITMIPAPAHRQTYGITHISQTVHDVSGRGVHNHAYPHRVLVWQHRPNPRNGQPVQWGPNGPINGGVGAYLDPSNRATDDPISVRLSAEPIALTERPIDRPTAGQPLTVGQSVTLLINGTTAAYVLTARPLADPVLTPA